MMYKLVTILLFVLFSHEVNKPTAFASAAFEIPSLKKDVFIENAFNSLHSNRFNLPDFDCFSLGLKGFYKLKEQGKVNKEFLTIVDYSLPSTAKRLWIIDTKTNTIIFNSLVAHGKKSGANFATSFSNKSESNKSSLGFFTTGETYVGKHGLSLKLDGLENGLNDKARNRAIVMHGADYVSEHFIKTHNRLGLSQGCPALPTNISTKIITTIKGKSCLFIYHPSMIKNKKSKLVS